VTKLILLDYKCHQIRGFLIGNLFKSFSNEWDQECWFLCRGIIYNFWIGVLHFPNLIYVKIVIWKWKQYQPLNKRTCVNTKKVEQTCSGTHEKYQLSE